MTKLRNESCDKSMIAGQKVYLGPTIHLLRPEFCFDSHHSYIPHAAYFSVRIRFQKGQ